MRGMIFGDSSIHLRMPMYEVFHDLFIIKISYYRKKIKNSLKIDFT